MTTLQNNKQAQKILEHAEKTKYIERKLRKGAELSKDDIAACKNISGDLLFGYSEAERIQKLKDVEKMLQDQLDGIKTKAGQV